MLRQQVHHEQFRGTFDEDDATGKKELGARNIEIALKLLTLAFVERDFSWMKGLHARYSVDEAGNRIELRDARKIRGMACHEDLNGFLAGVALDLGEIAEKNRLEL